MSVRREETKEDLFQASIAFIEDGNVAALSGYIQSVKAAVERENIRVGSYGKRCCSLLALQIEDDQFRVFFTGSERLDDSQNRSIIRDCLCSRRVDNATPLDPNLDRSPPALHVHRL